MAVRRGQVGYSTNLDAAMQLVANHAKKNNVPQEDMPEYILVLSDMEFNPSYYRGKTNADSAKKYFTEAGYKAPNFVWWNIQSRNGNMRFVLAKREWRLYRALALQLSSLFFW